MVNSGPATLAAHLHKALLDQIKANRQDPTLETEPTLRTVPRQIFEATACRMLPASTRWWTLSTTSAGR